eukprot:TRINITY_DN9537_c0_g1_i1.p1 TRINITY_DN9537_c0_g1~~TRINITY_DN9537_c0_g1_i1.p1  ORF type:complete len:177 (-),score=13.47 TRINITY_DN9537_c0_g1_i1:41-571(-)
MCIRDRRRVHGGLIFIQENSETSIQYDLIHILVLAVPWLLFQTEHQQKQSFQYLKPQADKFLMRLLQQPHYQMREALVTAMLNQIRYPNKISKYFMDLLQKIFSESKDDALLEQITALLVERLIVKKPHPWCQVYFFFELQKNVEINLKSKQFWQNNEYIFNQLLKGFSNSNENDI